MSRTAPAAIRSGSERRMSPTCVAQPARVAGRSASLAAKRHAAASL